MTHYKIDVAALRRLLDPTRRRCLACGCTTSGPEGCSMRCCRRPVADIDVVEALLRAVEERDALVAEADRLRAVNDHTIHQLQSIAATAIAERDALLAACDAKNALLACYRIGKSPSDALQKRLDKANEAIRRAKEPTK